MADLPVATKRLIASHINAITSAYHEFFMHRISRETCDRPITEFMDWIAANLIPVAPAQAALQERDRITALIQIERDEARRVRDELLVEVERLTRERDQLADARNAALERANFMYTMTREAQEIASAANEHAAAALREVEALRVDAERYRWLRAKIIRGPYTIAKVGTHELYPWCGDNPDAAIDAALKSPTTGKWQQV